MPELPEVETIRRALRRELTGLTLRSLAIYEPRLLQNASVKDLKCALVGQTLQRVERRAKFLLFDFGQHTVVLHLRMTGWPTLQPVAHPRFVFTFSASKVLYFEDVRRFATLHLLLNSALYRSPPLVGLGIEPFSKAYTLKNFSKLLQTDQEIKRLLLDQRKIVGVGNIYACEALFASRIHPQRPAESLTQSEGKMLFVQIKKLLERAIAEQGTSVSTYRQLEGESGNFQNLLLVYHREGEPCVRCKTPVARLAQGGRGTYYCPQCQQCV